MRLIWKKYDAKFNAAITIVGLGSVVVGAYGMAELLSHALRDPILWIFAAIPLLAALCGIVTLAREYQLWKTR
jgi:hypothetical protein